MRLIDADKLKKYLKSLYTESKKFRDPGFTTTMGYLVTNICKDIDRQPTISTPHWTPVSERLPEMSHNAHETEHDVYEIDDTVITDEWQSACVICATTNEDVIFGWFIRMVDTSPSGKTLHDSTYFDVIGHGEIELKEIAAWMPLPEPYKEEP